MKFTRKEIAGMKKTFKLFSLLLLSFLFSLTGCIDASKSEKSPGEYSNGIPPRSPLSKKDSKDPDTVGDYRYRKKDSVRYPPAKAPPFKF